MSKHDLQGRPIYHHKRESIEAHLTIMFGAITVSHWIEIQTGWSIKKFVRTGRRYSIVKIKAGNQILTTAEPLPAELRTTLTPISKGRPGINPGRPFACLLTNCADISAVIGVG